MELDPDAIEQLAYLTAALDEPDRDLLDGLVALVAHVHSVVPSCLGLSLIVTGLGWPTTVTLTEPDRAGGGVGSSLLLAPPRSTGRPAVSLVLYAGTPGAFVDLAADVSWLTGPGDAEVVVDQHLTVLRTSIRPGPAAASTVHQAIGVLIGRGHLPAAAASLLQTRADLDGGDLVDAAEQVLGAILGTGGYPSTGRGRRDRIVRA